jgi:hypothetical protein
LEPPFHRNTGYGTIVVEHTCHSVVQSHCLSVICSDSLTRTRLLSQSYKRWLRQNVSRNIRHRPALCSGQETPIAGNATTSSSSLHRGPAVGLGDRGDDLRFSGGPVVRAAGRRGPGRLFPAGVQPPRPTDNIKVVMKSIIDTYNSNSHRDHVSDSGGFNFSILQISIPFRFWDVLGYIDTHFD